MKKRLFGAICLSMFLVGCAVSLPKRETLVAVGPLLSDPVVIFAVDQNSSAKGKVEAGDRIVALDGLPVASIAQGVSILSGQHPTLATIQRGESQRFDIATRELASDDRFNVSFLPDGAAFTSNVTSLSGQPARAGLLFAGRLNGSVAAFRWLTDPNVVELEISISVPPDCADCTLRNVSLMDWSRRAWLSAVPLESVAHAVLPDQGAPGSPIAVPPPVLVAQNSVTNISGNFAGQSYGNQTTGTFSGNAYTTTTPIYDYSGQSAALGYNLGVAIRNARIEETNRERYKFVGSRAGNLRAGTFNSGELVTGHLFFAAPQGFGGPYVVFVDAGPNVWGAIKFEPTQTHLKK